MGGTGCPLGKTFFLHCQRRHPELPKIPTYLALPRREALLAHEWQAATEALLRNAKATPLASCLGGEWDEDYAKSDFWAIHWEVSSRPESELAWQEDSVSMTGSSSLLRTC